MTTSKSYSKTAANKLLFCLLVIQPSLPNFHFKILLCFIHVDQTKRTNQHANKSITYWPPFWNKVYSFVHRGAVFKFQSFLRYSQWLLKNSTNNTNSNNNKTYHNQ